MALMLPNFDAMTRHPELDPAVVVGQMFESNDLPNQLVFTAEFPNLRWVLRQAHLEQVNWWHAFDVIQAVDIKQFAPLMLQDLGLMPDMEPFMNDGEIYYYLNGRKQYHLILSERQFVLKMEEFLVDGSLTEYLFDDRGFLASKRYLNDQGEFEKQEWFTPAGQLVMTKLATGRVKISTSQAARFKQTTYPSVEAIVAEVTLAYFMTQTKHRTLIVDAANPALPWLDEQPAGSLKKFLVLMPSDMAATETYLPEHAEVMFETQQAYARQKAHIQQKMHVVALYPTQLALGTSIEQPQTTIYFRYSTQTEALNQMVVDMLTKMVSENEALVFQIEFANQDWDTAMFQANILAWIGNEFQVDFSSEHYQTFEKALAANEKLSEAEVMDYLDEELTKEDDVGIDEDEQARIIDAYQMRQRIQFLANLTAEEQAHIMQIARLFIDLDEITSQRVQMLAVSAGIPQIVSGENEMIVQKENGMMLTDVRELPAAIHYFLDSMKNWNRAVVTNVQKIDDYAESKLVHKWEEVMHDGN